MLRWWKGGQQEVVNDSRDVTHNRVSFEVRDEALDALKAKLQNGLPHGNTAGVAATNTNQTDQQLYESWRVEHPCILQHIQEFLSSLHGKRLAIFLDYDGTLTPIVSNPDQAIMSEEMREAVKSLAQLFPTGIISGRGREKVEKFVQLSELYYAGSHGMDIAGPQGDERGDAVSFQPAADFAPLMDTVYQELQERFADIPGASVEHNKFCVSAHFRNCCPEDFTKVISAVEQTLNSHEGLKKTNGRKVLELRPKVDWDKGRALDHLLEVLGLKQDDVVGLYVGDDTTDEDAFQVLKDSNLGMGILVSTKVKPTFAKYTVRDPNEVKIFLERLVEWGRGDGNGWSLPANSSGCIGWKPSCQPPAGNEPAATAGNGPAADAANVLTAAAGHEPGVAADAAVESPATN